MRVPTATASGPVLHRPTRRCLGLDRRRTSHSRWTSRRGPVNRDYAYEVFGGIKDDGCNKFSYDGFDRLIAADRTAATASTCTSPATTYGYDGLDRQVKRDTAAASGIPAASTAMSYDGWNDTVVHQTTTGGATPGTLDWTLDADGTPKTARTGAATAEFLAEDGTGSIGLVTGDGGNSRCLARYDAYGQPDGNTTLAPPGSCASGQSAADVFYRGARKDAATGRYQLGSRTYDPTKGAFLTPDTFRTGGSSASAGLRVDPLTRNTYAYVNGDPVNLTDPSGHNSIAEGSGSTCSASCQQYMAQRDAPRPQHRKKNKHGWGFNLGAGVGKGLWALGPGLIGDAVGLIPTDATHAFRDTVQDSQRAWQDWSGADTASKAFRGGNITTQVIGTVADGVGIVKGAVALARAAPRIARGALSGVRAVRSALRGSEEGGGAIRGAVTAGRNRIALAGGDRGALTIGHGADSAAEAGEGAATTAARNFQFGELGGPLGETDLATGEITIQRGLTGRVFDETLRHETVHSVLTPSNPLLNSGRAWLYQNSQLWRFGEEAAAETYATRSIVQGLAFPLGEGYGITFGRLGAEFFGAGAAGGGSAYGIYEATR